MDVRAKTDAALDRVFEHYYNGFPEFPEDEEPEEYAVYSIRKKPANFASGVYHSDSYWVSVSIISAGHNTQLYDRTEESFSAEGFIFSDATDVSGFETAKSYPHKYQYSMEFLIDTDRKED